jgi:hypothetical protein
VPRHQIGGSGTDRGERRLRVLAADGARPGSNSFGDRTHAGHGAMLKLSRNTLSGSYRFFKSRNRRNVAGGQASSIRSGR